MLQGSRLKAALARVKPVAVHGPWWRLISYRHLLPPPRGGCAPRPLWGGAARLHGARFTPPGGFDSIYLAGDPITALMEVQSLVLLPRGTVGVKEAPSTLLAIDGVVSAVLDLTDPSVLKLLGTNEQEMTGIWSGVGSPPTHRLGEVVFQTGAFAGMSYGSARYPAGNNLVVFAERLRRSPPTIWKSSIHMAI